MKTSKNGIAFIEKEEGVILRAYDDYNDKVVKTGDTVKGTLTIGTGHTSAAGAPKVFIGQTITRAEADAILASDLKKVEDDVNSLVKVPLTQNQFDALVSFQFNTGGLGRSAILRALNKKDYEGAAAGFMNWTKGNGDPNLLTPRRTREKTMFLTKDTSTSSPGAAGATAVIVGTAGTAVISQTHHLHNSLIIGGIVLAVIAGIAIYTYIKHRKSTNV